MTLVGRGSRSTAFKKLPASLFFLHNSKNKNRMGKDLAGKDRRGKDRRRKDRREKKQGAKDQRGKYWSPIEAVRYALSL